MDFLQKRIFFVRWCSIQWSFQGFSGSAARLSARVWYRSALSPKETINNTLVQAGAVFIPFSFDCWINAETDPLERGLIFVQPHIISNIPQGLVILHLLEITKDAMRPAGLTCFGVTGDNSFPEPIPLFTDRYLLLTLYVFELRDDRFRTRAIWINSSLIVG